jgi:peptidoglycan/xylan/chitin deacetylase (PgdA/CDA1 family)
MKTFPRFLSRQAGRFFSPERLFGLKTPCFLPFYHVVSNEKLPHILNYPYRNVQEFENELDFFLKHFEQVSLEQLVSEKCRNKKAFHLSFDDGLRECSEIVAPLLLKKGIPATFFINTAFTDNKKLFHKYKASLILNRLHTIPDAEAEKLLAGHNMAGEKILTATIQQESVLNEAAGLLGLNFEDYLKKQQPYLTSGQLKNLADNGFTIGAHSHNHPEFWTISEEQQMQEVKESMAVLQKIITQPLKTFAFPYADWGVTGNVLKALHEKNICDITFGTAGIKNDEFSFHFQRYPAEQPGNFVQNLKGEFVYFKLRKWVGKATVIH